MGLQFQDSYSLHLVEAPEKKKFLKYLSVIVPSHCQLYLYRYDEESILTISPGNFKTC